MLPLPSAFPARLPSLADVEHGAALHEHCLLTFRPTSLLIRRVKLAPEQVSADPRSRRRRTLHPGQRALPIAGLQDSGAIYGYSFILTNLDVSAPGKAAVRPGVSVTARARLLR
jgi:hypothetical protein